MKNQTRCFEEAAALIAGSKEAGLNVYHTCTVFFYLKLSYQDSAKAVSVGW